MVTLFVGSASAAGTCTADSPAVGQTTCVFSSTGGEQTFTVPAGVTSVMVSAVGAPGGSIPFVSSVAGKGAAVTATVALPAGTTTLYVEVGGVGGDPATCSPQAVAPGGFNGGGDGVGCAAAGGGASDVRTSSASLASRLVVAGGGGGPGTSSCSPPVGTAGDSSVTGPGDGADISAGCETLPNPPPITNGGFGGTQGGSGGTGSGLGQGGNAVLCNASGAGGGAGGYFGGGAGFCGGNGGAGSSFWVDGATNTSMSEDTTGTPSVSITYTTPPPPCTQTGFYRDGINLTAKQIGGNVTGTLDATGCNIGVYYGPGTSGTVSGTISGSNYYGVVADRAAVNVTGATIHDIGETQPNGSQHGVGVLYTTIELTSDPSNTHSTVAGHATGTLSGSSITNYQKNGVVISGAGTSVTAQSNTVTGYGMINYIAQNGIEIASGATALVKGNTVSGNWYTPKSFVACGLLFFQAGGVKQSGNNLVNNEVNLCNAGRGGGNYKP